MRTTRLPLLLGAALLALSACPRARRSPVGSAVGELLTTVATKRETQEVDALVAALAALGEPAIPFLAEARSDGREEVRLAAIEALAKIGGERVVDPLLASLADPSASVRLRVVEKLGELRTRRAVEPLLAQYGKDEDAEVRYESLTSLGLIGDAAALDLLVRETRHDDRYVRMWAMDALCQMDAEQAGPLGLALLTDPDVFVRAQVLRSCGGVFDTPAGHRALIELALHDGDFQASVLARRHLHAYVERDPGGTLAAAIRAAARRSLPGPRAALLLGDLGDPGATRPLIAALRDPDPWVRHHAAFLLGRIGDRRAVPALVALLGDPVQLVAGTARGALGGFAKAGDARAEKALQTYRSGAPSAR